MSTWTSSPAARPPAHATALAWRALVDPVGRSGAENMALDQALLDEVERRDDDTACLRLYRWKPACLSLGRNEPALARYDRRRLHELGVDVVRRPTGGRAVWHDDEVTYAVAAPVAAFGRLRDSYEEIHRRLARALRSLGVDAALALRGLRPAGLSAGACFAQPVGGEVVVAGRKLVGSAQIRQGRAFLQHGSILLGGSQDLVARVSRHQPTPCDATSLIAALGRRVTFEEVAAAIAARWLTGAESWLPHQPVSNSPPHHLTTAFADPDWTWRR